MTGFKRVFVDTAPFIYYLENNAQYKESIKRFFTDCLENKVQIVTSVITVEEYLVFPYSSGKMEFAQHRLSIIAERGAKIRGQYKAFKAMDALQIATAIISGCDMFFTNDKQLRQEKELPCITVEELMQN